MNCPYLKTKVAKLPFVLRQFVLGFEVNSTQPDNEFSAYLISAVTIDGGAGRDSIFNSGSQISINGGKNCDSITNNGSNVTIEGGAGYDVIKIDEKGDNALIKYNAGDGDELITGFKANSTLAK